MSEVVMLVGSPASGKSSVAKPYADQGYVHISRDKSGGKVADLLPVFESNLKKNNNIILDNTYPTPKSRQPFIELAKKHNIPIRCEVMGTSMEDSSINSLHRMWDRYGKLFLEPNSLKEVSKDPNMFPIVVLFKYRKEFVKPDKNEGFSEIKKIPFKRQPLKNHDNKALILDYDDTLRTVKEGSKYKFPTNVNEIDMLPGRTNKLKQYKKDGYILLGVSNQSGIARGQLSEDDACSCFEHTNKKLGVDIEYSYCPHNVPPSCYCRKPQSGLGVMWIRKYKLDPAQTIYVGDQTTDKTFAKRLGFKYFDAKDFFDG